MPANNTPTANPFAAFDEDLSGGGEDIVEVVGSTESVRSGSNATATPSPAAVPAQPQVPAAPAIPADSEEPQEPEELEAPTRDQELLDFLAPTEVETPETPATTPAQDPTTPAPQKPAARDYSAFTPDEARILKKAPNEVFNWALEQAKAKRAALAAVPAAIVPQAPLPVHEEAYLLTPEYKSATQVVQVAEAISKHWQQQYALARSGKQWQPLEKNAKGEFVLGAAQEASAEAESEIMAAMNMSHHQQQDMQRRLNEIVVGHKTKVSQLASTAKAAATRYFPMYDNPAPATKQLLENVGVQITQLGLDSSHPAFEILRRSAALNIEMQNVLKTMRKGKALASKQVAAGPTTSHTAGSATSGAGAGKASPAATVAAQLDALTRSQAMDD